MQLTIDTYLPQNFPPFSPPHFPLSRSYETEETKSGATDDDSYVLAHQSLSSLPPLSDYGAEGRGVHAVIGEAGRKEAHLLAGCLLGE